jgi:D-3-phosphoglycerate dehydrogenase / 2-oxoglutarate reductase
MTTAAWNVLVTAQAFAVSGQGPWQDLLRAGCHVRSSSVFGPLSLEHLITEAAECDAIIAATDPYDQATFEALPRLKLVARCGVGVDSVDMQQATAAGVIVTNVPHAMTDAVADYCMGLLLTMVRRIHEGFNCMRAGGWAEFPGVELCGKQLGLIGFGQIGQAVAQRASGFGLRIVAYDPQAAAIVAAERFPQVRFVSLDELLEQSHFVSIHAPNIPATRNLIDAAALQRMRADSYLINTSRGALIDETALMAALERGTISGAAIDVYQNEPLPANHPLRKTPRLLLTPHNAFNSQEAALRMSLGCAQPILDLLAGNIPEFVCNRPVWESPTLRLRQGSWQAR